MINKTQIKPRDLLAVILLAGLISCQAASLQPAAPTPVATPPSMTDTPGVPTATQAVLTSVTADPTLTPTSTGTPLSVASFREKGLLLWWDDDTQQYSALDLNTGTTPYNVRWNPECGKNLLPNTTISVCEHPSGQQYLYDILQDTEQDVPIWDPRWISWSPNSRFLIYSKNIQAGEQFFSYEISTNLTQTLTMPLERDWLENPALSANGQTLLVTRNYAALTSRVFEVIHGASQYRQVGLDNPFSTLDIAWSPVSSEFVYGATDIEQEVVPAPNYLFFVSLETGEIRELAESTRPLFFWSWSLEWSPAGNRISVGLWDQGFQSEPRACVIEVDTAKQVCLPALRSLNGRFLAWSPSGDHIAFVDTTRNLVVSNPDGTETIKLLENAPKDFLLFWR